MLGGNDASAAASEESTQRENPIVALREGGGIVIHEVHEVEVRVNHRINLEGFPIHQIRGCLHDEALAQGSNNAESKTATGEHSAYLSVENRRKRRACHVKLKIGSRPIWAGDGDLIGDARRGIKGHETWTKGRWALRSRDGRQLCQL